VFKLLLSSVRKWGGLLLNKQHLRLVVIGLGFLVYLFGHFAAGMDTLSAILLALSGPGAMVADAVIALFRGEEWRRAGEKAEEKAELLKAFKGLRVG